MSVKKNWWKGKFVGPSSMSAGAIIAILSEAGITGGEGIMNLIMNDQRNITLRRRDVTRTKSFGRKDARWGLRVAPVTRFQARMTWRSMSFAQEVRVLRLRKIRISFKRKMRAVSGSHTWVSSPRTRTRDGVKCSRHCREHRQSWMLMLMALRECGLE